MCEEEEEEAPPSRFFTSRRSKLCAKTTPEELKAASELLEKVQEEKRKLHQRKKKRYLLPKKRYLIPEAREMTGVTPEQASISRDALQKLIKAYCRKSGMKNLQKHIEKILRKSAFSIVKNEMTNVEVTETNLQDYVGKPVFYHDRLYDITPIRSCNGPCLDSYGSTSCTAIREYLTQERLHGALSHPILRKPSRFPLDNPELLKKWVIVVRRVSWLPNKSSRLCSDHFTTDSYKSDAKHYLKHDAVPSIFNFPIHLK